MSKLDTVRALIQTAGRLDTPIDEARTAALAAARLILKEGFIITTPQGEPFVVPDEDSGVPFPDDDYDIPDFSNTDFFEEVQPFSNHVATHSMRCVSCNKEIRKGVVFTRETQKGKDNRVAHYECRRFFAGYTD